MAASAGRDFMFSFRVPGVGRALGIVTAAVVASALTATIILAVSPPDPGPFTGCLATADHKPAHITKGQIYNVAASATTPNAPCVPGDTTVGFGQGAKGDPGPSGEPGASGAPGADGTRVIPFGVSNGGGVAGEGGFQVPLLAYQDIAVRFHCELGLDDVVTSSIDVVFDQTGDVTASTQTWTGSAGPAESSALAARGVSSSPLVSVSAGPGAVGHSQSTIVIGTAYTVTMIVSLDANPSQYTCVVSGSYTAVSAF
jgi:hypothetical protein